MKLLPATGNPSDLYETWAGISWSTEYSTTTAAFLPWHGPHQILYYNCTTKVVHLLLQADATAAASLIKTLQRSAAGSSTTTKLSKPSVKAAAALAAAGLFKWELQMHVAINTGSMQHCSQVTIPTNPGYRLLAHSGMMAQTHPLLLALGPKPLPLGVVQAEQVKQLFSSFAWDEELAVATVLLPVAVLESSPAWARYITLCAVSNSGLEAVSESSQLLQLAHRRVGVQPWRSLPELRQQQLDCSMLDVLAAGDEARALAGWRSHVVVGQGAVVVEVVAPAAIDAGVSVKVAVTDTQLTVTISEGGSGQSSSSSKATQGSVTTGQQAVCGGLVMLGEHSVQLPDGVFVSGGKMKSSTRLSRAMGLMCIAVTAV
jgi:hypothetical protein